MEPDVRSRIWIRMVPDADLGSGSALQCLRIQITDLFHVFYCFFGHGFFGFIRPDNNKNWTHQRMNFESSVPSIHSVHEMRLFGQKPGVYRWCSLLSFRGRFSFLNEVQAESFFLSMCYKNNNNFLNTIHKNP